MNETAEVLAEIKDGNERVIARLYQTYRAPFLFWARKFFALDEATILDVFQDAVIVLYQNVVEDKLTELNSSLKTYLFGIGKNLLHKRLRKAQREIVPETEIPEQAIAPRFLQLVQKEHQQHELRTALATLGDRCRQLLTYFYYYEYSIDAITHRMEYKNDNTVKAHKHRCLQQLRQRYQNK